jgi:hypothetical protein
VIVPLDGRLGDDFGAINFYTQWFERLGVEPSTIIVAGLTTVVRLRWA